MKPETIAEKTARLRTLRIASVRAAAAGIRWAEERRVARGGIPSSNRAVFDCMSIMPFGKYKGKTLLTVIEEDHGWIIWAMENIPDFEITNEAQAELDLFMDVRRGPKAWEQPE